MTKLYNVLQKERSGEAQDADEQRIHEQGLVGVLQELHDELDAAVAEAYGWPADLDEEEILYRLVALNKRAPRRGKAGPRPLPAPALPSARGRAGGNGNRSPRPTPQR